MPSAAEVGNPENRIDELTKKKSGIGGRLLNHGFIAFDSFMRVKDGESIPVAVGKAVLTNAAFSMLPGGIVGGMALMAVASAPEVMNQLDAAASGLNAKKQQFGGNFQQTEAQMNLLQSGVGNMQSARAQVVRSMSGHARNAQQVY